MSILLPKWRTGAPPWKPGRPISALPHETVLSPQEQVLYLSKTAGASFAIYHRFSDFPSQKGLAFPPPPARMPIGRFFPSKGSTILALLPLGSVSFPLGGNLTVTPSLFGASLNNVNFRTLSKRNRWAPCPFFPLRSPKERAPLPFFFLSLCIDRYRLSSR